MIKGLQQDRLITTGFLVGSFASYFVLVLTIYQSILGLAIIVLQSSSIVRRAFYETFLHMHIALALLAIAALWYHLEGFYSKRYLTIVIATWALEVRSLFRPFSLQLTSRSV